jgi:xanthine/uracil permease
MAVQHLPSWPQTVAGSGITVGSLAAIVLNLAFNVLSGKPYFP